MGIGLLLFLLLSLTTTAVIPTGGLQLDRKLDPNGEENPSPFLPEIPPNGSPVPLFNPSLAPSPVSPFFNISSGPKLSGKCPLNFSSVDPLITTTAHDCLATFAPYLATVICCPQLSALLSVLLGRLPSLSLDPVRAHHCLSDLQLLLSSQGAQSDLKSICALGPANFSAADCPVQSGEEVERALSGVDLVNGVDLVKGVMGECGRVDQVKECCERRCEGEIERAAERVSSKGSKGSKGGSKDGCKKVVVRWVSGRLEPGPAKRMLRQMSNCNVNGVCPLVFPDTRSVARECAHPIRNVSHCCAELDAYVAVLANQSFITNLQALDCAAILAVKLQGLNVTKDVYSLCDVSLKDFSLQVGTQESGCLLPSVPSDVTLDPVTGVSFTCDLNDNIAAPWPSSLLPSTSSCNNKSSSVNLPALPAATGTLNSVGKISGGFSSLASLLCMVLQVLIQA